MDWETEKKIGRLINALVFVGSAAIVLLAALSGLTDFLAALLFIAPFDLLYYFLCVKK